MQEVSLSDEEDLSAERRIVGEKMRFNFFLQVNDHVNMEIIRRGAKIVYEEQVVSLRLHHSNL